MRKGPGPGVSPFQWRKDAFHILDQRLLPLEERYIPCRSPEDVLKAISGMAVRGAPAIGISSAFGMALAARVLSKSPGITQAKFISSLRGYSALFRGSRRTAVNLENAMEEMDGVIEGLEGVDWAPLLERARLIHGRERRNCLLMGKHGHHLIREGGGVLTICNTGSLATGGTGTALGVVREAFRQGRRFTLYVPETRPFLQGARLTAWEMMKEGVDTVLIVDSAAASIMDSGKIDIVIVGADRVFRNGDTVNKIGTLNLAILASHFGIPFYVAAPGTSFDLSARSERFRVEERGEEEVARFSRMRVAPEGVRVFNPVFDLTPGGLVQGFITDKGVLHPPFSAISGRS